QPAHPAPTNRSSPGSSSSPIAAQPNTSGRRPARRGGQVAGRTCRDLGGQGEGHIVMRSKDARRQWAEPMGRRAPQLVVPAVLAAAVICGGMGAAHGAPALRFQVQQKGDFVLLGNTLAQDCSAGVPDPVVGTVGACGSGNTVNDTGPDI